MDFSTKLGVLIEARGTSQSQLARETGIAQSAISKMTARERRPYLDQGYRIARALGVSLDYLADDARDEPPTPALTAREREVWEMIRAIGVDEAWRRLLQAPPGFPQQVVESQPVFPPGTGDTRKKDAG